ncbi:MAG TPA: hypothetical protein PKY93_01985 [Methanothrix sp.]|nr:hypothetical protein [Methanothrix sp.]HPC89084.1 hypothetical protein [Methanothrix sp.]HRS84490.1 hypothetical protein [Methanothrix sp.]
MRFKLLILSSLFLAGFLAVTAIAANWYNSESLGADELISGGEVETYVNPNGFAATPQKQRELEKNKTSQDWTMPSTLTGGGNSAKSSRAAAEAAVSSESTESATNTSTATAASTADTELPPATVATVGGSWSFLLNDTDEKEMALSLFQKDGDVFGAGKMRAGNSTVDVAASGSVSGSNLELNLVSLGTIRLYKLDLDLSGEAAAGQLLAISTSGESWTGRAEGQKTA